MQGSYVSSYFPIVNLKIYLKSGFTILFVSICSFVISTTTTWQYGAHRQVTVYRPLPIKMRYFIITCEHNCSFFWWFQGRIHQIEYAMEAVKQGSATVGLKSKTHAVLVALKVHSVSSPSVSIHWFIVIKYTYLPSHADLYMNMCLWTEKAEMIAYFSNPNYIMLHRNALAVWPKVIKENGEINIINEQKQTE